MGAWMKDPDWLKIEIERGVWIPVAQTSFASSLPYREFPIRQPLELRRRNDYLRCILPV